MRKTVVKAVEDLVREATLLARDANQRREDAERLLRHLNEGVLVCNVSYFPDMRPLGIQLLGASVRADTIMRLEVENEEKSTA